jgi:hypothetical protein
MSLEECVGLSPASVAVLVVKDARIIVFIESVRPYPLLSLWFGNGLDFGPFYSEGRAADANLTIF